MGRLNRYRLVLLIGGIVLVGVAVGGIISTRPVLSRVQVEVLPRPVPPRDLADIQKSGELRVLTRNNPQSYFLFRGREMGFEYELAEEFAARLGVEVVAIVPPGWTDLIPWLLQGKGDIIAAAMTKTPERASEIAFTVPYQNMPEVLVTRRGLPKLQKLSDIEDRTIHVREGSSYESTLLRLKEQGVFDFTVEILPSYMETSDIIGLLLEKKIEITTADQNIAMFERTYSDSIVLGPALTAPGPIAWGIRPDSPDLLSDADTYLTSVRKTTFFNYLVKKYYIFPKNVARHKRTVKVTKEKGTISSYDRFVQTSAEKHEMNWLLLSAQIFQESRFDPNRESWAGAIGLTQLLPSTAREIGVGDPWDPRSNIEGGARYLKRMYDHFESSPPDDRMHLALASYCAGLGHVIDARAFARLEGKDPTLWAGNVEEYMLKLSEPEYYRRAKHGYARGEEAVTYANDIMRRWHAYATLLGENAVVLSDSAGKPNDVLQN